MRIRYVVQDYGRASYEGGRRNSKRFNDLGAAFAHAEKLGRRAMGRLGKNGLALQRGNWGFSIRDAAGRYVTGGPVIIADLGRR
jgi:hypothetical protein